MVFQNVSSMHLDHLTDDIFIVRYYLNFNISGDLSPAVFYDLIERRQDFLTQKRLLNFTPASS